VSVLAHVTRNKLKRINELKTNKRQCPLSPKKVQDPRKLSELNQND